MVVEIKSGDTRLKKITTAWEAEYIESEERQNTESQLLGQQRETTEMSEDEDDEEEGERTQRAESNGGRDNG